MSRFDLIINVTEALIIGYTSIYFVTVKKQFNSILILILFSFGHFFLVSSSNLFIGYESYSIYFYHLIIFLFLKLVSEDNFMNILFVVIVLSLISSYSVALALLSGKILFQTSIYTLYENSNSFTFMCIVSKIFQFILGFIFVNCKKFIRDIFSDTATLFLLFLFLIDIIFTSLQGIGITDTPNIDFPILLSEFILGLTSILTIYLLYYTHKTYLHKIDIQSFKDITDSLETQIAQYSENEKTVTSMRHDLMNQMVILDSLIDNKEYEKVKQTIRDNKEKLLRVTGSIHTGNLGLDAIIATKMKKAQDKNLIFTCAIDKSYISSNHEIEYGLVLGNALDNAIVHNVENGYIELNIKSFTDRIEIKVINSTVYSNDANKNSNTLYHGIGIKNMQRITDNLNGSLSYGRIENEYVCLIILPN